MQTVAMNSVYNVQTPPNIYPNMVSNMGPGVQPNLQAGFQQTALQSPAPNVQTNIEPSSNNTAQEKKFGKTVLDSAIDVAKTVAGGVAVGAVSGGAVSLLPFDNTELVTASLHDTILNAARESDTLPENLKNAGEPFNMAKELLKAQDGYVNIRIKETLVSAQLELAKAMDDESIKTTINSLSETLKGTGVNIAEIPADVASNSNALEALKTDTLLKITEAINKNTSEVTDAAKSAATENILKAKDAFIESIKKFIKEAPAGDEIVSAAKTQAKIASSINLIGKAISFAVIIALVTKMFDIMQPKKEKTAQGTENTTQAQAQGQSLQGGNVWNMFSQSAAQGQMAQQNGFNKFMTLG